ncbi:MAG: hypothetical protein HFE80_07490 [Clostridiaceae bacterium]|jgi:hypothetical protein|nr:hypothetical protein [Clostridiaceae bacterium]
MKCRKNKKNCPLNNLKGLLVAGICAAAALLAVGAAIGGRIARRRKKARLEPIIFEPPVPARPAEPEAEAQEQAQE